MEKISVLIIEDSDDDVLFLLRILLKGGYDVTYEKVDTASDMRSALAIRSWDIITSDNAMPQFNATKALALAKEISPTTPFIIVSGEIDQNLAVSLMRNGAKDFIPKNEIARIVPVIKREMESTKVLAKQKKALENLYNSEVRYRRLFETAQDGILILNAETMTVIDVNPFLVAMLGYTKESFIGKQLWELGAFKDINESKQAYRELQDTGYIRYNNLPLQTSSGDYIDVEFVSNVYLVDGQKIAQCNIRDISDRTKSISEIQKLNQELELRVLARTSELELINSDLESFNYSVSHDLRAPLRGVLGYIDIIKTEYINSPDCLDMINKIDEAAKHMNNIIDALLELSKFSHQPLQTSGVNLSKIARSISDELRLAYPTRHVNFSIRNNIVAHGDEQFLRIVLENLMNNAWKFTAYREVAQIEFDSLVLDEKPVYFLKDNGAGINMEYADKLFKPFQRFHNELDFPGIGIGLATVNKIIQKHGGRIWAESVVNEGTTFYFTLS